MSSGNRRWAGGSARLLCRRVATPVFVALIALGGLGTAQAQESSPAASPAGSACVVAAEGTGASPAASPAADALATPVSDEAVIGAATTTLDTYYSCLSETSTRGSYGELTVSAVSALEDGSLLVNHQVTLGKQVLASRATLVESNGEWAIAAQTAISPKTNLDMVTLAIKVADGAVSTSPPSAEAKDAVSFHGVNSEKSAQTFVLLGVPEKFDPTSMTAFDPAALPEGITLVGELPLAAAAEGDALFVGLEPGTYAVFAVGEDGTLATGTVITLTEPVTLDVPSIFDTPEATPAS